ncbi:hypothetical protein BJV74DRAFT_988373 [Russula compacta]|nr:hypothetical protein BJV74DRAFT_988373 [Russula compacta]
MNGQLKRIRSLNEPLHGSSGINLLVFSDSPRPQQTTLPVVMIQCYQHHLGYINKRQEDVYNGRLMHAALTGTQVVHSFAKLLTRFMSHTSAKPEVPAERYPLISSIRAETEQHRHSDDLGDVNKNRGMGLALSMTLRRHWISARAAWKGMQMNHRALQHAELMAMVDVVIASLPAFFTIVSAHPFAKMGDAATSDLSEDTGSAFFKRFLSDWLSSDIRSGRSCARVIPQREAQHFLYEKSHRVGDSDIPRLSSTPDPLPEIQKTYTYEHRTWTHYAARWLSTLVAMT